MYFTYFIVSLQTRKETNKLTNIPLSKQRMKTIMTHKHAFRRINRPFLEGMGSVMNISGKHNAYKKFVSGNVVSDTRRDWEMVGLSIREAINDYQ